MTSLSDLVLSFIVNALWQISVLLIIACACAGLIIRLSAVAARKQYLFWSAVFILSVCLPVLSLFNAGGDNSKFAVRLPFESRQLGIEKFSDAGEKNVTMPAQRQHRAFDVSNVFSAICVCYFLFLAWRLFTFLKNWRKTALLRRSVKNEKLPPLIEKIAEQCCAGLKINSVPIFLSSEIASPLTFGTRNPIIILPESFADITSEDMLTAVLGHELVHVNRRDYGWNLFYEFLSLPVSFHPAIDIIKRKIRQTREMACDETVVGSLLNPHDYARSLVRVAGFISSDNQNAYTLGVFGTDILEKRIMKLLEKSRCASERAGKIRITLAISLLAMTAIAASVYSINLSPAQTIEAATETTRNTAALKLISFAMKEEENVVTFSGRIQNISPESISDFIVLVKLFDSDGKFISSTQGVLFRNAPFAPNETLDFKTSAFKKPAMKNHQLVFKNYAGETIEHIVSADGN